MRRATHLAHGFKALAIASARRCLKQQGRPVFVRLSKLLYQRADSKLLYTSNKRVRKSERDKEAEKVRQARRASGHDGNFTQGKQRATLKNRCGQ